MSGGDRRDRRCAESGQDGVGVAHGLPDFDLGGRGAEVFENRGVVETDLAVADQVIGNPIAQTDRVRHARGPAEPVDPAQPGQAQAAPAELSELLMDVPLLAAEPAKRGIEARPGRAAAREQPEPLHRDVEGLAIGMLATARVESPGPPHLAAPDGSK